MFEMRLQVFGAWSVITTRIQTTKAMEFLTGHEIDKYCQNLFANCLGNLAMHSLHFTELKYSKNTYSS